MTVALTLFRPREDAPLDLESLLAVAETPERLLSGWLAQRWPGADGLVLSGLELQGLSGPKLESEPRFSGPPGCVRPEARSTEAVLSPGSALLTTRDGRRALLRVDAPIRVPWPTAAGPAAHQVLVLSTRLEPGRLSDEPGGALRTARAALVPVLGFVSHDQAHQSHLLPLASATGNMLDWATDLQRVWQPDHPSLRVLARRLELLERTIWRSEPEGTAWDRQALGRSWPRYQTTASAALQAARLDLRSRVTTTLDRVRLLDGLYERLHMTVERAASGLLQIVGPPESAGPYRAVGSSVLGSSA